MAISLGILTQHFQTNPHEHSHFAVLILRHLQLRSSCGGGGNRNSSSSRCQCQRTTWLLLRRSLKNGWSIPLTHQHSPIQIIQSIGQQLLLIMADQSKVGYQGWHQNSDGLRSLNLSWQHLQERQALEGTWAKNVPWVFCKTLEMSYWRWVNTYMGPFIGGSTSIQFINYSGRENKDSRILQSIPTWFWGQWVNTWQIWG